MLKNPYRIESGVAFLGLQNGMETLVDEEDLPLIAGHRWRAFPNAGRGWYVVTGVRVDGRLTTWRLHRVLMGSPRSFVDHVNCDGLDNRRSNLRLATRSQNAANSKDRADRSSSPYRGVYKAPHGRFDAQIRVDGVLIKLGKFVSAEEAARAYDRASRHHFGAFGRSNFDAE